MKDAIFLDFYGTVVFEDGENIEKISKIIQDTGEVNDISEVGSYWWNEFYNLFVNISEPRGRLRCNPWRKP